QTAWPDAASTSLGDITDGPDETILLVESARNGVNWLDPRDLTFRNAQHGVDRAESGIVHGHPGGVNVLFADTHTRFLSSQMDLKAWKAFLTKSGGDKVPDSY